MLIYCDQIGEDQVCRQQGSIESQASPFVHTLNLASDIEKTESMLLRVLT